MPAIGLLSSFSRGPNPLGSGPIAQGLGETGYNYGPNVRSNTVGPRSNYDRLPVPAANLVSRKVDVIVTDGSTPPAVAAAAYLYLARTITRRAERLVSQLAGEEPVNPRGAQIPQPPLGPPLRARPLGQRRERPRRPLAPRRQPPTSELSFFRSHLSRIRVTAKVNRAGYFNIFQLF
jgi:hypothetical protein